mmetsp:Transcript_2305/g.5483  ORF Transcript_2305/g.5483 Transcript_2305/m.5483 type:complete len:281 (+) Transcript_2305:1015-1857(+)
MQWRWATRTSTSGASPPSPARRTCCTLLCPPRRATMLPGVRAMRWCLPTLCGAHALKSTLTISTSAAPSPEWCPRWGCTWMRTGSLASCWTPPTCYTASSTRSRRKASPLTGTWCSPSLVMCAAACRTARCPSCWAWSAWPPSCRTTTSRRSAPRTARRALHPSSMLQASPLRPGTPQPCAAWPKRAAHTPGAPSARATCSAPSARWTPAWAARSACSWWRWATRTSASASARYWRRWCRPLVGASTPACASLPACHGRCSSAHTRKAARSPCSTLAWSL